MKSEKQQKAIGEAILRDLPEGVIPVDEYEPESEDDIYVSYSGKVMIVNFNKVFSRDIVKEYEYFDISYKEAYYTRLPKLVQYINYFEKFYDEDKELLMIYMKLKFMIDSNKFSSVNRDVMIKAIQELMFTDSLCKKIKKMCNDNYRVVLNTENPNKRYAEVLQFNELHANILMRISIGIKFMIPIVLHYIKIYHNKTEVKNLFKYYYPLFNKKILVEDVNILGKLAHSIISRVRSFSKPESYMYQKHEAIGSSKESFVEDLLYKNIITDTIFAYVFNGNIISFNSVVLKQQLSFHSKEDLKMDFTEITMSSDSEGLSGLEKLEMYTVKIDTFEILFSQVNIEYVLKKLKKKYTIKEEEIEFYSKYHDFNVISKELIFYYYAKYFGGFRDLVFIKRRQYVEMLIMLKHRLESLGNKILNQIISARYNGKSTIRIIRNSKFLEKIKSSSIYEELIKNKYSSVITTDDTQNPVIELLNRIINSKWIKVEYPNVPSNFITLNNEILAAEYLYFVSNI